MGKKNKISDLNDHLFEQLERLNDDTLTGEELDQELKRATGMSNIAEKIIENGKLALQAIRTADDIGMNTTQQSRLLIGASMFSVTDE